MANPQVLEIECVKCQVKPTCPRSGSSPLLVRGKKVAVCRLIGGYGKVPVDPSLLSAESIVKSKRDGECLTIAEVPMYEEGVGILYDTILIFAPPVLHPREKISEMMDRMVPKNPTSGGY